MLFSSLVFIFAFLPAILALYYLANKKYRNVLLCIASFLFYAWGEPKYIILMLVSIFANYIIARLIAKTKKFKKLYLSLALIINLGLLAFFKYATFSIKNINLIAGSQLELPIINLPIGISFYTFQILSYIIDVYRGKVRAQKNIINLATYIAFFPQLVAGPIVQYIDIEKQLNNRRESADLVIAGIKRFIIGLAKKVIIANNVAYIADTIYQQDILSVSTAELWLAAIAYMLQIYFDFSGYSDMAIGLGKMFGFNFLENFNYPYIAKSITDFWRRWHISLSSWFRDYVYIPLGGNRCSKIKWVRNILAVWMLTGLWHGASWNYVLWGLYFGVLLLLEKTLLQKLLAKIPSFFQWLYSMFFVLIGWVVFRIESLHNLKSILGKMFDFHNTSVTSDIFYTDFTLITALPYIVIGILFSTPLIRKVYQKIEQKCPIFMPVRYLIYLGLFGISVMFLLGNTYNPFIYFRF